MSNVSEAGPISLVFRIVPFSGKVNVTALAVHTGGAGVGDKTTTGALVAVGTTLTDDDDALTGTVVRVAVG